MLILQYIVEIISKESYKRTKSYPSYSQSYLLYTKLSIQTQSFKFVYKFLKKLYYNVLVISFSNYFMLAFQTHNHSMSFKTNKNWSSISFKCNKIIHTKII